MSEKTDGSEEKKKDTNFSLPKMFSEMYYANVMTLQEEKRTISHTFIALQMMISYTFRALISAIDEENIALKNEVIAELEKATEDCVDYKIDIAKRNIDSILEKNRARLDRHSAMWKGLDEQLRKVEESE